jgi:hypothetical protein
LIKSLLGKNIYNITCGGVHNIILVENEPSSAIIYYKMMKEEKMTDFEIILDNYTIKCHKYILISRSSFFYNKIIKDKNDQLVVRNMDCVSLRTVIDYLYLNEIAFVKSCKSLNILLDIFKIAK